MSLKTSTMPLMPSFSSRIRARPDLHGELAVRTEEEKALVLGEPGLFSGDFPDGNRNFFAGLIPDQVEDLDEPLSQALVLFPAGQGLGHGVHESYPSFPVGGDDPVANAGQDCGQPALALFEPHVHAVLVQGHLDGRIQLALSSKGLRR